MKSALYEVLLSIQRHFPRSADHYFHDLVEETAVPVERLETVMMALSLAHAE
jgi:hypothetical protein